MKRGENAYYILQATRIHLSTIEYDILRRQDVYVMMYPYSVDEKVQCKSLKIKVE